MSRESRINNLARVSQTSPNSNDEELNRSQDPGHVLEEYKRENDDDDEFQALEEFKEELTEIQQQTINLAFNIQFILLDNVLDTYSDNEKKSYLSLAAFKLGEAGHTKELTEFLVHYDDDEYYTSAHNGLGEGKYFDNLNSAFDTIEEMETNDRHIQKKLAIMLITIQNRNLVRHYGSNRYNYDENGFNIYTQALELDYHQREAWVIKADEATREDLLQLQGEGDPNLRFHQATGLALNKVPSLKTEVHKLSQAQDTAVQVGGISLSNPAQRQQASGINSSPNSRIESSPRYTGSSLFFEQEPRRTRSDQDPEINNEIKLPLP